MAHHHAPCGRSPPACRDGRKIPFGRTRVSASFRVSPLCWRGFPHLARLRQPLGLAHGQALLQHLAREADRVCGGDECARVFRGQPPLRSSVDDLRRQGQEEAKDWRLCSRLDRASASFSCVWPNRSMKLPVALRLDRVQIRALDILDEDRQLKESRIRDVADDEPHAVGRSAPPANAAHPQ